MRDQLNTIIIVISLFFSIHVSAQSEKVVYLKNGSEIKGVIIDSTNNGVKLQQKDGSIWFFDAEKITRVETYHPMVSRQGMFTRVIHGVMGGTSVSPVLQITNGFRFNSHLDAGLGVGIEELWGDFYVPIYLSGRYNVLNTPFSPFIELYAGYDMSLQSWEVNKGGFTSGARLGITKNFANKLGISTSLGYRYAYLKRENNWWDDFETLRHINRIEIAFSLNFN